MGCIRQFSSIQPCTLRVNETLFDTMSIILLPQSPRTSTLSARASSSDNLECTPDTPIGPSRSFCRRFLESRNQQIVYTDSFNTRTLGNECVGAYAAANHRLHAPLILPPSRVFSAIYAGEYRRFCGLIAVRAFVGYRD